MIVETVLNQSVSSIQRKEGGPISCIFNLKTIDGIKETSNFSLFFQFSFFQNFVIVLLDSPS